MLYTGDRDVARRFVAAGGGQYLRTITIIIMIGYMSLDEALGMAEKVEAAASVIVDDFRDHCPNVTSMSVCYHEGIYDCLDLEVSWKN